MEPLQIQHSLFEDSVCQIFPVSFELVIVDNVHVVLTLVRCFFLKLSKVDISKNLKVPWRCSLQNPAPPFAGALWRLWCRRVLFGCDRRKLLHRRFLLLSFALDETQLSRRGYANHLQPR
jgi:hypothetical protein